MTKNDWTNIYNIVGAAMEVHKVLGRGMSESIYQEALEEELSIRKIPFEPQKELITFYKGIQLKKKYIADIISNDIVIELKSVSEITPDHRSQLFNYLRITNIKTGILINFGEKFLRSERYTYDEETDSFELLTQDNYKEFIH